MTTRDANEVVALLGRILIRADVAKLHSGARRWPSRSHIRTMARILENGYQYREYSLESTLFHIRISLV
jgi:hypothetical protein